MSKKLTNFGGSVRLSCRLALVDFNEVKSHLGRVGDIILFRPGVLEGFYKGIGTLPCLHEQNYMA